MCTEWSAEARATALEEARRAIAAEARRGEWAAPPGVSLSYSGGLRRAARIVQQMAGGGNGER